MEHAIRMALVPNDVEQPEGNPEDNVNPAPRRNPPRNAGMPDCETNHCDPRVLPKKDNVIDI